MAAAASGSAACSFLYGVRFAAEKTPDGLREQLAAEMAEKGPEAVRRLLSGEADTVQKALDIEARASHEDGQTAPGRNVSLERSGQRDEIRHTEGLVRLQNIHRMVRDAVGLVGRDLRRTDV